MSRSRERDRRLLRSDAALGSGSQHTRDGGFVGSTGHTRDGAEDGYRLGENAGAFGRWRGKPPDLPSTRGLVLTPLLTLRWNVVVIRVHPASLHVVLAVYGFVSSRVVPSFAEPSLGGVDVGDSFLVRHPRLPRRRDRPFVHVPILVHQRVRRPRHFLREGHVPVHNPVHRREQNHDGEDGNRQDCSPHLFRIHVLRVGTRRSHLTRSCRFTQERQRVRIVPENLGRDA